MTTHTRHLLAAGVALALLVLTAPASAGVPDGKPQTEARPRDRTPDEEERFQRQQAVRAIVAQFGARDVGTRLALLGVAQASVQALDQGAGEEFWFNRRRQSTAAAVQLVGVREPIAVLALRIHGRRMLVWPEKEIDQAPALNSNWLAEVNDKKAFLDLRQLAPDELMSPRLRPGYYEYLAYCEAVVNSAHTARDAFVKSAAENRHLNFTHLYNTPDLHRGKVVPLEGRLKRVTRFDAPREAQRRGVRVIYEGWIFLDRPRMRPVCVIFTDLPPGLSEGDNVDRSVSFEGYFFKKFDYVTGEKDKKGGSEVLTTLLFIGPTVVPLDQPSRAATRVLPLSAALLYGVIGFVTLVVALIVGLNLWYRRSDRQVRARLAALQAERLRESGSEGGGDRAGGLDFLDNAVPEDSPPAEGDGSPPPGER
ncbi:MAG: hypothetical protein L0Z62_01000 [Gemmataceae bacterium]|nr:hypothetical protein [Gemmataceae bacterium]